MHDNPYLTPISPAPYHDQMIMFARPSLQPSRRWSQYKSIDLDSPSRESQHRHPLNIQHHKQATATASHRRHLHKNDTHVQYNLKYYSRNKVNNSMSYKINKPKEESADSNRDLNPNQSNIMYPQSPSNRPEHRSPLGKQLKSAEKKEVLQSLLKEYETFKDMNALLTKAKPHQTNQYRMPPIKPVLSKHPSQSEMNGMAHISHNRNLGHNSQASKLKKGEVTLPRDFDSSKPQNADSNSGSAISSNKRKNSEVQPSAPVLDSNGRPMPLRLLLSNKVRSKIVKDLLGENKQEVKNNIRKLNEKSNELDWLQEFTDINHNLNNQQSQKKKHRKQLLSRNYQNAYYQMFALTGDQKRQLQRKYYQSGLE